MTLLRGLEKNKLKTSKKHWRQMSVQDLICRYYFLLLKLFFSVLIVSFVPAAAYTSLLGCLFESLICESIQELHVMPLSGG